MRKKIFILAAVLLCVVLFGIEISTMEKETDKLRNIEQVKAEFQNDIKALRWGKYSNLTASDFVGTIDAVEKLYHIQILKPGSEKYDALLDAINGEHISESYKERTLGENFAVMVEAINKFFPEGWDTSGLRVDFWVNDAHYEISYDEFVGYELAKSYVNGEGMWIFGNAISQGGYMIQTQESLLNTWFSKGGFDGGIHPSMIKPQAVYRYLSGVREGEDVLLHLADGEIWLSELEENVLQYLNTDAFPLPKAEGISYAIGEARVIENVDYEGVCFKVRRVYEGVPFEYSHLLSHDSSGHDNCEIAYIESDTPDTMLLFGKTDGIVERVCEVKEILTLEESLEILSQYLSQTAKHEVQGIELVYRDVRIPNEAAEEVQEAFVPKWKFLVQTKGTKYQYYYYVDVVTGEVTYRYGNDK